MNIKFIKKREDFSCVFKLCSIVLPAISIFLLLFVCVGSAYAVKSGTGLSLDKLLEFAQNDIFFYDPSDCIGGNSSGICGDTAEEKIWSILRQSLDPLHTAAAFGSIAEEGGFQPVKWEYYKIADPSTGEWMPGVNWDDIYNGVYDGRYGVGSFAITSGLSDYLHYINDNEPDLLKYFKDPSNTSYSTADDLAEKIGQEDTDRLIELEVNYFINEWIPKQKGQDVYDTFLAKTDLHDAAVYWAHNIEVCSACGYDGGSSALVSRPAKAQEYYDKYKDYVCIAGSDSSDITLIGDSIAVQSEEELQSKFSNGFLTMVGSRHPTSKGVCSNDEGGLDILEKIASGKGSVAIQHSSGECDELSVDENSLKGNVVWELGTNAVGANKETIDQVIELVGKNKNLFLVTPYNGEAKESAEAIAQIYRDAADENDNVYVIDWANAVKDNESKYITRSDGMAVHPTDEGKKLLANLISDAVSKSGSSDSSSTGNTSSSGGSSSSGTGIKWDDGWIVEESMNGAEIENMNDRASELNESPNGVGTYNTSDGKPNKILLHSTEEIGRDGIKIYPSGNVYPAHFVINLKDKKVWQHFSIYQPSLAIASHDKDGPIQIEIVGFSTPSSKGYESEWDVNNFSDEDWDYLAKLLLAISEETGIPLTSSMSWGDDAEKFSAEEFLEYEGILGHMHVPDNDHTDPGDIWEYVEAAIKRQGYGCVAFEGEYPEYRQYDERWGDLPYGHDMGGRYDGYFRDSACGPTAMAVIVTMTSGQEVLPTDVADLLEEEYDGDPLYWVTPMSTLDPIVCEKYGCEAKVIEKTEDEVRQYLKDGWYIHTSGSCGGGHSSTCPYSAEGHYVALLKIDNNDIVTIEDPGWGDSAIQEYKLSDIVNNMGAAVAIRGNGSSSGVKCSGEGVCKDNNSSSAGKGVESDKPIAPIHDPSEDIPCDPRTKDLGVRDDAYYDYEQYSIRLCSIPNIKMTGTQGDDGDDGYVHVNSRVSGAFYALSEEHKKKCGNYLEAYDDYRTNEEQTYYYNCYITGSCNGGTLAAVPGSKWSNHQGGLAIDFDTSTYCSSDSSVASGPGGLLNSDFLAQFGLEDGRNFSQFENWHVQAAE